nr:HAD family phosphatase [bacterium]
MIQGAIFDADGTLLDSMRIWNQTGERYLRKLGVVPEDDLSAILFPMTLEQSSAYLKKRYALPQGLSGIQSGILEVVSDFYRREVMLKNGVGDFLYKLSRKRIPMAIVTAGDHALLEQALDRLQIGHYFQTVLTCGELGTSKYQADIYRAAAGCLASDIQHTAVFEDVYFALKTAHTAGFATIAVEDAASAQDQENIRNISDFYITDFTDFDAFWKFASAI